MAKEREDRKKKEKKEKKRREAEELEVKEKKISKKSKSKSKTPEKSKKKSKKVESDSESEEKPHKKSKEKKKKKHKRAEEESEESEEDDEPQTQIVDSTPDSDSEFDKEDIKQLLESYTKEELVNLIYKTVEKGSRLVSAVYESAERDSTKRNIFVRGLGWDTTHENLKTAFEVYGEIEECSVVMDKDTGKAKGFGFVLFKTRKATREALRNPEKRMFNRTVSCSIAVAKPFGAGKSSREAVREPVESVKIDLTHTGANQADVELGHGHQQHQNMPMYARQNMNMPFYGQSHPPGYNPMYGAMMLNQAALMGNHMVPPIPNYRMFAPGMMNQVPVPPNHVGMMGQYVGEGNGTGNGVSPAFDDENAWYPR